MPALPKSFGSSAHRKEDARLITGTGRYTDDVSLPGQTFGAFVRSPVAHANLGDIDVSEALAHPGVLAVYTGREFAQSGLAHLQCGWMIHSKNGEPMRMGEHPALASERVRYAGDAVAIVIAESKSAARLGAELVMVDYDELPIVVDVTEAGAADAPQLHPVAPNNECYNWELGDAAGTAAALADAAHVCELTLVNNRLAPNAIETRAVNASYDAAGDRYTAYVGTQNPHGLRMVLAAFIGFGPEHKVRVISEDVGGGFGSKAFTYTEEVACLWASKLIGRPVKWAAERSEAFLTDRHGRDHVTRVRMGLDKDNRVTGLHVDTQANLGAYLSSSGSLIPTYVYAPLISGQYKIPNIHVEVTTRYTNTSPVDAYRGAGRPEAGYVIERIMDVAARELGVDPAEFRRQNFIREFPYDTGVEMVYDVGDFQAHLDKALALADESGFAARKAEAQQRGKRRGFGIGCYIEAAGIGPSAKLGKLGSGAGMWESAEVRVNPTGSIEVLSWWPTSLGSASTTSRLCMAIPTWCSLAWARWARALARWVCPPFRWRATK